MVDLNCNFLYSSWQNLLRKNPFRVWLEMSNISCEFYEIGCETYVCHIFLLCNQQGILNMFLRLHDRCHHCSVQDSDTCRWVQSIFSDTLQITWEWMLTITTYSAQLLSFSLPRTRSPRIQIHIFWWSLWSYFVK